MLATTPIEGPPYIYPILCNETILSEYDNSEEIVKKIDMLGREIKAQKGFYFDVYRGGEVLKMYQIQ